MLLYEHGLQQALKQGLANSRTVLANREPTTRERLRLVRPDGN